MVTILTNTFVLSEKKKEKLRLEKNKLKDDMKDYLRERHALRRSLPKILLLSINLVYIVFINLDQTNSIQTIWKDPAFIIFIVPLVIYSIVQPFIRNRNWKKNCRLVCLYTSVSAAESLQKGDLVEGSFYATKLFDVIRVFSGLKKIKIGLWKSKMGDIFNEKIEVLSNHKKAISKSILENEELISSFSNNFYSLANSLFLMENKADYNSVNRSLNFFFETSQKYFEPNTFMQRHKKVNHALKIMAELMKIIIAPLLALIFWLIFGFK